MNELSQESSPYLLQHAQNPVHWKSWNDAALDQAKSQNKLIIISIGYSACHWCHVMEHETFEDDEAAEVMNDHFINIKIDREERPDIDAIYMKAVQIMTQRGGWPLNVVCLPDGRPVWGGTYFRKDDWIETLEQLQKLYANSPEKMVDYAEKLHNGIQSLNIIEKNREVVLDHVVFEKLLEKWTKSFDTEFGGMARAPKFMMPNNYKFLLRYGYQTSNQQLLDFVNLTLTKMAYGGIFDPVGGGFSRYSVDMKWHVPHFEKMLYDNGQLVSLYANAYKLTKNPLYKEVIEKTLDFVSQELTNEKGGFYCALDADSLDPNNQLEEGAFYVWTKAALQNMLKDDFAVFSEVFNINTFGYWEKDHYVLIQKEPLETIALRHNIPPDLLQDKKRFWENLLFQERKKRLKPRLDDKCLTSWNAIMLKGYVDAYKALQDESYLEAALKNAHFITENLWQEDGSLLRNHKNGKSSISGFLEDYALLANAFIAVYEVTMDEGWLKNAKQLVDYCLDHFCDKDHPFFSFKSDLDTPLIASHYEVEDNVIPASNSVMAENLYLLSIYFSNSHYEKTALKMLQNIIPDIDYPSAFSNWLLVFLSFSKQNRELAITGENARDFLKEIQSGYFPNVIIAATEKPSTLPFLKGRFTEAQLLFYVCQDKACQLPTASFEKAVSELNHWK